MDKPKNAFLKPLPQLSNIVCPKHPNSFISLYNDSPVSHFFCISCTFPLNTVDFKSLLSELKTKFIYMENHLGGISKDLVSIEKDQIAMISSFKHKFMEIFDQYETDARGFFLKLQQGLHKDLDLEALCADYYSLPNCKDIESLEQRLHYLDTAAKSSQTLSEKTSIVLQELKDFSNELALFLTDSLETLKKSYLRFSRVCSDQIAQKSNDFRKKSIILSAAPHKSLEINGSTPFAKDLVLLSTREGNPSNFKVCTCSNDEKLRIWQFNQKDESFTLLDSLQGHSDWINRLLFVPDRNLLFSSSRDSTIKVWNMENFKCMASLSGHTDSVFGLSAFSNDSPILASGSYDKTVKLWDFETGELKTSTLLENSIYEIRAYSVEVIGVFLVAGDSLGTLSFFLVENGIELKKRAKIKSHEGCILRLCYMEKEKALVSSANKDKFIKIWNALTLSLVHQVSLHDERGISGLFYEEKDEVLFTAGKDNVVKMVRVRDFEVIGEWKDSFIQFGGIAWEKEKKVLLTCGGKKIGSGVQMTINLRFFR